MQETRLSLLEKLKYTTVILNFLMNLGILKKKRNCWICRKEMLLRKDKGSDGKIWECKGSKCKRRKVSVRKGSVFENKKISLFSIIMVIYEWSVNTPIKRIKHELQINYKTINWILMLIRSHLQKKQRPKIGGENKIVEIDESAFSKRKYKKGRFLKRQVWCVGGICRETKKTFFEVTLSRSMTSLEKILKDNVEEESLIYSDEWRGYKRLKDIFTTHETVCHKNNFLNPANRSVHTQNIETVWRWLKEYRKLYGNNIKKNLKNYIFEYQFKKESKNSFYEFWVLIRRFSE